VRILYEAVIYRILAINGCSYFLTVLYPIHSNQPPILLQPLQPFNPFQPFQPFQLFRTTVTLSQLFNWTQPCHPFKPFNTQSTPGSQTIYCKPFQLFKPLWMPDCDFGIRQHVYIKSAIVLNKKMREM
jgi:hypothetical protein